MAKKKSLSSDILASWGQHVRFRVPTCPPETEPKSVFLDFQEGTYLKIAENVKIWSTLKRKPYFWGSGASQNPPKIDEKSMLRAFYVELNFWLSKKSLPDPPRMALERVL